MINGKSEARELFKVHNFRLHGLPVIAGERLDFVFVPLLSSFIEGLVVFIEFFFEGNGNVVGLQPCL